jgi:uncharacterized RDD family membrane protein YckC
MKTRFQPDAEARVPREPTLIDPEAYDASEQQFAASLEETSPRFVVQSEYQIGNAAAVEAIPERQENVVNPAASGSRTETNPVPADFAAEGLAPALSYRVEASRAEARGAEASSESTRESAILPAPADLLRSRDPQSQDPDAWRQEVAARLNNYRARRRPREPRYPSLRLKFESSEPAWSAHVPANESPVPQPATRSAVALEATHLAPASVDAAAAEPVFIAAPVPASPAETTARIIPFPRSANAPPRPLEELAGPVPGRPRILEVPEVAPPPPALGGILIESMEEPVKERRPGFEVPLQAARLAPRLLAAAVDGVLVLMAIAMSGWIFFEMTMSVPPARQLAGIAIVVLGICWFGYQYLLLVYTGTTPGLKLGRLRLSRFDGGATPRRIRRWRVLASALSGVSLGLGYAWCVLDEDQLCWHDRITRTYLAPETPANVRKTAHS